MTATIVLLLIIAASILWFFMIYNRLISLKNRIKNGYSQIDVQLKRRYDLIPNLVETAKGYLQHERETLEAVIKARQTAVSASQKASADPGDAQGMQQLMAAEASLGGALGRLFALQESYPDLKADSTMLQLQEELTSTENRISFSRQAYNDSVMEYNTAIEVFPNVLVASPFNFRPATFFELDTPEERVTPKVSF